ncbi:hypothetical protein OG871_08805 [Kitasatospora sp. NBC_00374]|uniref:hypothetical protein n=1 Tax=Kitasatospora sp. NBC_00374 TaxID=2975964 RepID=UPI0030E4D57E
MTREAAVALVERIKAGGVTDRQVAAWSHALRRGLGHPRVLDLIFLHEPELTAEQVVDEALAYRPIAL